MIRHVFVNSADCEAHGDNEYTINMNKYQIIAGSGFITFCVMDIQIPQGYYHTIREGVTDLLVVDILDSGNSMVGGGTLQFTPGTYNVYELMEEFNTQWADTLPEYDCTIAYSKTRNKLSLKSTTATYKIKVYKVSSTCAEVFGLSEDLTCEYNTTTYFQNCFNSHTVTAVDVYSSLKTSNFSSAKRDIDHCIARVGVSSTTGILTYANQSDHEQLCDAHHISSLTFQLKDQRRRTLDLNGLHWNIHMRFTRHLPRI